MWTEISGAKRVMKEASVSESDTSRVRLTRTIPASLGRSSTRGFSDGQKSAMTAKMSFVHLRTSNPALACPKLFGDRDELVAITL